MPSSAALSDARDRASLSPAKVRGVAIFWGFAEATVFFIVPDVFTSRVVLTQGAAAAFRSCVWAVVGALAGGIFLFVFARANPSAAGHLLRLFDHIPGISPALIEAARIDINTHGSVAFFTSAAGGVPYKVCTLQASLGGIGFITFLVMSLLSRACRFVAVTSIAVLCERFWLRRVTVTRRTRIHLVCWMGFYVWYFWAVSP